MKKDTCDHNYKIYSESKLLQDNPESEWICAECKETGSHVSDMDVWDMEPINIAFGYSMMRETDVS